MVAPFKLSQDDKFHIYYSIEVEHKSTYDLAKIYKNVNQSTISRAYIKFKKEFQEKPDFYNEYSKWQQKQIEPPFLYNIVKNPDGSYNFESPYEWIVQYLQRRYARAKNKEKTVTNLNSALSHSEIIWKKLGKRNPMSWNENDLNKILAETNEGSKFSVAVCMRTVSPPLMAIENLTQGLKGEARQIPMLLLKDFPDLFRNIIAEARKISENEREADEIDLILIIKSQTGIRTGNRRFEQGLWGTKIAEGLSKLEVYGNDFTWVVSEKKEEVWQIGFKTKKLVEKITNFINKYRLQKGDYLISISEDRANKLLHKACDNLNLSRLNLHDCRKIYVSFLVRSKIHLESAIRLNVGWKDLNTANKHYLMFQPLWEELEEQKKRFEGLF